MIISKQNIFKNSFHYNAICVPTSGTVTNSGRLIMGIGITKKFKDNYPGLDLELGEKIIRMERIDIDTELENHKLLTSYKDQRSSLQTLQAEEKRTATSITRSSKKLEELANNLESAKAGVCPTCEQGTAHLDTHEKYTADLEEEIDKEKNEEIKKLRDRSIILIGFSGGFRRNEIVSLDYEDLDFVQEGLKISLKRSKTDQFGEGSVKGLPYFDNSEYCPVVSIRKWIEVSKINSGPLFRRFIKGSKLSDNRLSDQTIALLIKDYLKIAGIESKNYSGHSLRSGFATSAAESGVEERSIMAMTGHKSTEMVRRYIKEANLFKNNALNKIKL